jgi:hypothetical protein
VKYGKVSYMKWAELADEDTIKRTSEALKVRGVQVEFLPSKEEALKRLLALIPPGAEVMTGSSTTLQQIGFVDLLKSGNHPWKNLKESITKEKDPAKQMETTKKKYYLRVLLVKRSCSYPSRASNHR